MYYIILNPKGYIAGTFKGNYYLFVLLILAFILTLMVNLKKLSVSRHTVLKINFLLFCICYLFLVNMFLGLIKGNNFLYIIDDVNGYLFAICSIIFLYLFKNGFEYKDIFKHYVIASSMVAILYIVIVFSFMFSSTTFLKINHFISDTGMGSVLPYGNFIRIFLKNSVYCMMTSLATLIVYFRLKNKTLIIISILNMIPVILSFTRGMWIAYLLTLVIYLFENFISFKTLKINKKILKICIIFFLILFILGNQEIVKERFLSIFSSNEIGNNIKVNQIKYTMQIFENNIIFGAGAGYEYNDPRGKGYAIELTYNDCLAKYGVVGFLILFLFLLYPLIYGFILARNKLKKNSLVYASFYAYVALLIVGGTNPFLLSSLGMLTVSMIYGLILWGRDFENG
jgi:hypothetical protein